MSISPSIAPPLRVAHLVDAAGGAEQLWGKERVVHSLMLAQRKFGDVDPQLISLTNKYLTRVVHDSGFPAHVLFDRDTKDPRPYLRALREYMASAGAPVLLHTHGYKANLLGRAARWTGIPMAGLVSTCHGWVETTSSLRLYNALDRWTSRYSDAVTVPSATMLRSLGSNALFIPNGIPEAPVPTPEERADVRTRFGWTDDVIVAGTLGRLSPEKGIDVLIEAARATSHVPRLIWAVAGTGPLEGELRTAAETLPNLQFVGYVDGSQEFLPAIDIFVQPSWSEGLSLALLEAARARLPIVATRVGSTEWAVRDRREALLIEAGETQKLANLVTVLVEDPKMRSTLGAAARVRFEEALDIAAMQRAYRDLYHDIVRTKGSPTLAVTGS